MEPAVKGTLNVLKASSEAKVKRVVYVSSVVAVSMNPEWPAGQVKDENCWSDVEFCKRTNVCNKDMNFTLCQFLQLYLIRILYCKGLLIHLSILHRYYVACLNFISISIYFFMISLGEGFFETPLILYLLFDMPSFWCCRIGTVLLNQKQK